MATVNTSDARLNTQIVLHITPPKCLIYTANGKITPPPFGEPIRYKNAASAQHVNPTNATIFFLFLSSHFLRDFPLSIPGLALSI